jgi:nucleotide-binding universal stress UspA family protein
VAAADPRPGSGPGLADSGLERSGEIALDEGLALAKDEAPGLEVQTSLLYGWAPEHLLKLSAGEAMLVVGSRGIGGFMGLLVGSVSLEMAATASCPVAVIRADDHTEGPVVVAVDSSGSAAALSDACALASLTGAKLTVVHVQHAPAGFRRLRDPAGDGQVLLDSVLHRARETAPGISIEARLLTGTSIPRAILEATRGASITVIGTKGHGLIRGTIGSTAHAVLHHARGPRSHLPTRGPDRTRRREPDGQAGGGTDAFHGSNRRPSKRRPGVMTGSGAEDGF